MTTTDNLAQFDQDYQKARTNIENDSRFSEEYRNPKLRELHAEYVRQRAEAEAKIRSQIASQRKRAFKTLHKRERTPLLNPQAETAQLLRERAIRDDLVDELEGGAHPMVLYENAVRVGDNIRASILADVGRKYLSSAKERIKFAGIVQSLEPEEHKQARATLADADRAERTLSIGNAIRQRVNSQRERRLGSRPGMETAAPGAGSDRIRGLYNPQSTASLGSTEGEEAAS